MEWDECVMPLPVASLRPGVLNLVIVGVIIKQGHFNEKRREPQSFQSRISALFCPQEQLKWKCHFVNEVWWCFFFFLLITISQAVECQKVIPGFSEFSVTHRCVGQGPLWFWQLKKEAESPVRSRGSEDKVIDWAQRRKISPPPTHETAFIALPFESSQNFVQSTQYPYWRQILHSFSYWKTYFLCLALFWPYDHICFLTHPQYNLKPRRSQKDYTLSPF